MKWEYLVLEYDETSVWNNRSDLGDELDHYGALGWELINVLRFGSVYTLFFKRILANS